MTLRTIALALLWTLLGCASGRPPAAKAHHRDITGEDPLRGVIRERGGKVPPSTDTRERVIFVRRGSVWIMRPNGDEQEQLTVRTPESEHSSPALSPKGDRIAYVGLHEGEFTLMLMSVDDLLPEPLTMEVSGGVGQPTWSPDGSKIAFMGGDPRDTRDLMVVAIDGDKKPKVLVEGADEEPSLGGEPAWSPDGASIVFAADRRVGKGTTLWLVDANSGALTPLTSSTAERSFTRDASPSWSPDGKTIAFSSNRNSPGADHAKDYDLYTVRRDGSGLTRLTDDPGRATEPAYSPDGKRIYFVSTRELTQPYQSEIYVMPARGGEQLRLTRDDRPENLAPSAGRIK